jgi:hypothetical protein
VDAGWIAPLEMALGWRAISLGPRKFLRIVSTDLVNASIIISPFIVSLAQLKKEVANQLRVN